MGENSKTSTDQRWGAQERFLVTPDFSVRSSDYSQGLGVWVGNQQVEAEYMPLNTANRTWVAEEATDGTISC